MSITIDKEKIIAAIKKTDDERVLFPINQLLQIEDAEIPDWHRRVLEERTEKIKNGITNDLYWRQKTSPKN